jgi:hypothetical protein
VHIREFNPTPAAMLFGAWSSLMPVLERDGAVPLRWALVPTAAYLVGASYFLGRPPARSRNQTFGIALVLAALQGAVDEHFARVRHNAAGADLFHGTFGIAPAALLLSCNWSQLTRRQRWLVIAGLVGIATWAYAVVDQPRSAVDLACALAWPTAALVASTGVTDATERQTKLLACELGEEDEAIEAGSFADGCRSVIQLVQAAMTEAETIFRDSDLDPFLRAQVGERLTAIREAVAELTRPLAATH